MSIAQFENGFITKTKLNELVDGINANSGDIVDINAKILTADVTKTVGSGGDFTTLNMAIDWCKKVIPNGYTVELTLVAGFIMSEQILLNNVNLGFVTISSVDSEVIVNKTSILNAIVIKEGYSEAYPIFYGNNSVLPNIGALFNMNGILTNSSMVGLGLVNSSININKNKGFKNISGTGLIVIKSNIISNELIISSYSYTIEAIMSSILALNSNLTTSTGINVSAANQSFINISNSSLYGGNVYKITSNNNSNILATNLTNVGQNIEVAVNSGGILNVNNSPSLILSQTANTITSNGIIFK